MRAFALLSVAVVLAGCRGADTITDAAGQPPIHFHPEGVKVMPPTVGQRFAPTSSPLVAFDTETGSLCMTYDWSYPSPTADGLVPCDRIQRDFPAEPRPR